MSSIDSIDSDLFLSMSSSSGDSSLHSTSLLPINEALDSNFSDCLKHFNVIHINAQSIPAHYPDMLASFDSRNLHAILVSESWLKTCLPSTSYSLPGFRLIRNDRVGRGGGGVAIYLRSHIPFSIVNSSAQPPLPDAAEHLLVEITLSHTKILLGVFYCPPTSNYFNSFESLLVNIVPLYSHSIFMGDFNTCLHKDDSRSKKLLSIVESCNLHVLPLAATHFSPGCTPSLLDLILVSSLDFVSSHGQYPADAFSYHDLIFLSYKIRPPKAKSRTLLQRNFGGIDGDRLRDDAANLDWSAVTDVDAIDSKVEVFNTLLTQLYDTHAPIRPVKFKHLPAPWLTDEIKRLMEKKNAAKNKYKLKASDDNRLKYHKARNRCNTMCRDAQRRHIYNSVLNSNTAKTWKFLESLGVGKSSRNSSINTDIDLLNKHFSTSDTIDGIAKERTLSILSSATTPDFPPFTFESFTERDVKKNILSISSNAVGADDISRNMIVPILDIVSPILTHILNHSINTGKFPEAWKQAQIIPVPKKPSPLVVSDFRPISILPFLSKILEKLVFQQLSQFLNRHSLLNPLQSGFRPGHSTVTALIKVTDDIRWSMDNKQLTILTLLDFSNAFNTIDHDILVSLLKSLNMSPLVIDWFRSYLNGRRQRIRTDETISSWCDVTAGVPQGGVLSPLLFAIFINSITKNISSLYHMYADDIQIYRPAPPDSLGTAVFTINEDLATISEWSRQYGLRVNPTKSQAIVIGSPGMIARVDWQNLPPVIYNGVIIPYCACTKDLGICLDRDLSWSTQIKELSRKTFSAMSSLRRLRSLLPIPTKVMLAHSLLLSTLDYADASYLNLTEDQLNKLERLQNLAIRFIFGLRKYDHVSEFRQKLKWLPIRRRRELHVLSLLYRVLFDPKTPSYLKEKFKFKFVGDQSEVRTTRKLTLCIPTYVTKFYAQSFTVQAILLWNALPLDIRQSKSLKKFKKLVKNFYLSL